MSNRELTDEQYELADAIELWLEARYGRDFNTSQIARGVHAELHETYRVLLWMSLAGYVKTNGRHMTHLGRYSARYPAIAAQS